MPPLGHARCDLRKHDLQTERKRFVSSSRDNAWPAERSILSSARSKSGEASTGIGIGLYGHSIALQRHAVAVVANPAVWMPWNYQASLAGLADLRQEKGVKHAYRKLSRLPPLQRDDGGAVR